MNTFFSLFFSGLIMLGSLGAYEDCNACEEECDVVNFLPPLKGSIGPEISHIKRTREGGTSQKGEIYGGRASLERIARYKWYWGVEGSWTEGSIKGHSGNGFKLKSTLTNRQIEGRFGYTFQSKNSFRFSLTPFLGYGYWDETNHYKDPSPLLVRFVNSSSYFSFGFLSQMNVTECLIVGFNLKAKSLLNPTCKVRNDPVFSELKMHINDKIQYRFELPLYYDYYAGCRAFELGLVPFYELLHWGGRENYPFDFLDTKLRLFGINIQFTYRF